jgi:hypothetical protein
VDELDHEACLKVLSELIFEEGEIVFRLFWDSGGPGRGADEELIYKFRDLYWPHSSDYFLSGPEGFSGPFDSLDEALAEDLFVVTDATVSVTCKELSAEELVKRLQVATEEPGHTVELNRQLWQVSPDGELKRQRNRRRG